MSESKKWWLGNDGRDKIKQQIIICWDKYFYRIIIQSMQTSKLKNYYIQINKLKNRMHNILKQLTLHNDTAVNTDYLSN